MWKPTAAPSTLNCKPLFLRATEVAGVATEVAGVAKEAAGVDAALSEAAAAEVADHTPTAITPRTTGLRSSTR